MCKLLRFVGLGDGDDRGVLKWELGTAASERPSSFSSSESNLIPELVQNQDYGRDEGSKQRSSMGAAGSSRLSSDPDFPQYGYLEV